MDDGNDDGTTTSINWNVCSIRSGRKEKMQMSIGSRLLTRRNVVQANPS